MHSETPGQIEEVKYNKKKKGDSSCNSPYTCFLSLTKTAVPSRLLGTGFIERLRNICVHLLFTRCVEFLVPEGAEKKK